MRGNFSREGWEYPSLQFKVLVVVIKWSYPSNEVVVKLFNNYIANSTRVYVFWFVFIIVNIFNF